MREGMVRDLTPEEQERFGTPALAATIRGMARPRGVLTEETLALLEIAKGERDKWDAVYRNHVLNALKEGSFAEVSKATGLSTNTLQRWKREAQA